ncbi:hypothetical protein NIES2109_22680 [Nostoc sp. HK-01]|nr:hypothetical protein NIES2109_22680 [Nostoc sp. HK-01]
MSQMRCYSFRVDEQLMDEFTRNYESLNIKRSVAIRAAIEYFNLSVETKFQKEQE